MRKSTSGYLYLFCGTLLIGYAGLSVLVMGSFFLLGMYGPHPVTAINNLILTLVLGSLAALAGTWLFRRGRKILQDHHPHPDKPAR